jgi:hypothetical protein
MGGISFKGVEEAKDRVMTRPGTIGIFKISDVKFGQSEKKATYFMGVTFSRKEDEFSHRFYLSEKALPRVVSLVKAASGTILDGDDVSEEKLIALLKGKELAMKVTGRIDEENGKAYADLSFGGFCKDTAEIGELVFNHKEEDLNAQAAKVYAEGAKAKPEGATPPAAGAEEVLSAEALPPAPIDEPF